MNSTQVIGIVVLAIGIAVLVFGINASRSMGEQLVETVTGRFTDRTTWYIIIGIAAIVGGAALAFFGRRA